MRHPNQTQNPGQSPSVRHDTIGLLDVGTAKIVCLILTRAGSTAASDPWRVVGVGHQRSRGLKASVIADLDQAELAMRAAVQQAEAQAGLRLDEVFLSVSCGRLMSVNITARADLDTPTVTDADIARVMAGGRAYAERQGRTLLHLNRLGFSLDGVAGIHDPRGMTGSRLASDLHAVTADDTPLRNLMHVVERCHLRVSGLAPTPLASALAVTTAEERRLGVITIDIGAGSTTVACFADDHLTAISALPMGGHHITYDLARALGTPVAEAERIKTLYGSVAYAHSDEHDTITYRLAGDVADHQADHHQATRAELRSIILPRVDTILRQIAERIEATSFAPGDLGLIVLTGGASQLTGLAPCAASVWGRALRIGRPAALPGLPEGMSQPSFATAVGLSMIATNPELGVRAAHGREGMSGSYFGRVGQWLRESF